MESVCTFKLLHKSLLPLIFVLFSHVCLIFHFILKLLCALAYRHSIGILHCCVCIRVADHTVITYQVENLCNLIYLFSAPEYAVLCKSHHTTMKATKKTILVVFQFHFHIELWLLLFFNASLQESHQHVRTQVETF